MRSSNNLFLLLGLFVLAAWYQTVNSWHKSRKLDTTTSYIHHAEEDRPNYDREETRGSAGLQGVQPRSARGRPVMLEADANRFAAAVHQRAEPQQQQQQLPPSVTTKPPDPQSQLEQHLLDEHELEEEHKEQDGDKTLEEKQAHAHKQAAIALREPNMKPNIKQVPEKHDKAETKKHDAALGHDRHHSGRNRGHHWAGYKGPLVESKQSNPNSEFYTKYVHNTIEKKLAYPMIKGFWKNVLAYYPNATNWFDGGAGTCGVMEAALKAGKQIHGVELSDVSKTTCKDLHKQGLVKSGPLNDIPHPDNSFDLVFSSEVLEHVPPNLAEKSVQELVRIAQRDVFTTISLRPSALDRPGKPPKVHLCVRPRPWWEKLFEKAGCVRNEEAYKKFQQYDKKGKPISPHFFIYICDKSGSSAKA